MARKPKQKITVITDGSSKGTKVFINDLEVNFESISISGSRKVGFNISIGLGQQDNSIDENIPSDNSPLF